MPDLHESACAPELADAADSARPPVAGTCSGGAELGSLGGPASLNRLRRPPSTPDLMGISPCLPDRVLPTGHGSMNRQPAAASQVIQPILRSYAAMSSTSFIAFHESRGVVMLVPEASVLEEIVPPMPLPPLLSRHVS